MKLASQLKHYLKKHDITVAELGKAVKVSPKTIYSWLNGQRPRDITQVKAIANYFKVSLDELVFAETPEHSKSFEDFIDEINAGVYEVILRKKN
jgi:transcriptional regulator with XRE-family HTH domain